jgi:hypothetical protein
MKPTISNQRNQSGRQLYEAWLSEAGETIQFRHWDNLSETTREHWNNRALTGPSTLALESITSNHDAMIILTEGYPREDVARVVDAHTARQVEMARRAQAGSSAQQNQEPVGVVSHTVEGDCIFLKEKGDPVRALQEGARIYAVPAVDTMNAARYRKYRAMVIAGMAEPVSESEFDAEIDRANPVWPTNAGTWNA